MSEDKDPVRPKDGAPPARRPYSPPTITWDERLEDRPHLMASCAQKPAGGDDCNASPTS